MANLLVLYRLCIIDSIYIFHRLVTSQVVNRMTVILPFLFWQAGNTDVVLNANDTLSNKFLNSSHFYLVAEDVP